jgi:uncharacterized membrane protein YphA (DoxX/SURF4 family)
MKIIANISRILVGLVFIFSGFVKGVDPLGTAYRMEDYMAAFGAHWADPLALFLSIVLSALEFTLGMAMLLNLRLKVLSWPLLVLMIFFTGLTLNDAIFNPVPDCGCFGDAIKLTNWETFYKNVVLMVLVIVIFAYRDKFKPWLMQVPGNLAVTVIFAGFTLFSVCQYRHLPMIDFLGWKVGNDMVPDNPGTEKVYLIYKNKSTGETREYLSPNYPWNDTTWVREWEFVDQRIDDSGVIKGHTLAIFDSEGNELTEMFINNPGYQFLVVAYDLDRGSRKGFETMDRLYGEISGLGHSFVVLTGSLEDEINQYREGLHPDLEFYHADDVELKMMVRANPGLVLLKDGVVMGKWHWRDVPGYEELTEEFPGLTD